MRVRQIPRIHPELFCENVVEEARDEDVNGRFALKVDARQRRRSAHGGPHRNERRANDERFAVELLNVCALVLLVSARHLSGDVIFGGLWPVASYRSLS